MLFASRYLLNLHLLAFGVNILLMLVILWKQRSLSYRFEQLTWRMDSSPRSVCDTYHSYDGPSTIPIRQFPRKPEESID